VGRRDVFERLERKFRGYPRVRLVGLVKTAEIASDHTKLREIAGRDRIHRIIVDTDATSAATTLEIVRAANATGLQVSLLPSMLAAVGGSVVFDDVGGLVLMGVPRFGLSRSSQVLKRAFDLIGAGAAIVWATPLMALLAIAIKLDSRGPVLFRQTRVGRDGTPFKILKFRTMIRAPTRSRNRCGRTTKPTACSRSTPIRASRASADCCAAAASTSCPSSSTCCRQHEPRRPAPARDRRGQPRHGL
jgi:hypothetical protein